MNRYKLFWEDRLDALADLLGDTHHPPQDDPREERT